MSADHIRGEFVLTPVSPVHIGSGEVLQGIDYVLRGREFVVKDVRAFFEAHRDNPKYALDAVEAGLDIGGEYVRYQLPAFVDQRGGGQPQPRGGPPRKDQPFLGGGGPRGRKGRRDAQMSKLQRQAEKQFGTSPPPKELPRREQRGAGDVREFIKDPFGKVFLPASSFKGSVRTALACYLAEQAPEAFAAALREVGQQRGGKYGPNPRRAFEPVNNVLFGKRAHEDLLKALVMQDSQPLVPEECLLLAQVKVMNVFRERFTEKRSVPIQAECLAPGVKGIRLPFHVDGFVLEHDQPLKRLLKGLGAAVLRQRESFTKALHAHGAALARYECDFYADQGQAGPERFFQDIARSPEIHLPVGFGTGWHAKTVGRLLRGNDLAKLRGMFRMGHREADIFPKTRKWARCKEGELPMGWLRVAIEWK